MFTIRLATIDDLLFLPEIESSAAELYPRHRIPHPKETMPENILHQALNAGLLFIGEYQQQVVGFAACHLYSNYLHLDEVSVHPDFGKQGLGSALVLRVIQEMQNRKLKGCTLTTFEDLNWNAPWYKKLGFRKLKSQEIPAHVAAILRDEKSLGLKKRIGMMLILD